MEHASLQLPLGARKMSSSRRSSQAEGNSGGTGEGETEERG